jgi:hypothetical protein
MLTEKTISILKENGWTSERVYPVEKIRSNLAKNGFVLHKFAEDFLNKFGGLFVKIKDKEGFPDDFFQFISEEKTLFHETDIDDIDDYGQSLGVKLCPLGRADRDNVNIAISENGLFFAYINPYISLVGRSTDEALNNLCDKKIIGEKAIYTGEPLNLS